MVPQTVTVLRHSTCCPQVQQQITFSCCWALVPRYFLVTKLWEYWMMHEGLESNSVVKNIKYRCYPCLRHEKNIRVLSCKTKSQKVMKYKRVFIHFGDVQLEREQGAPSCEKSTMGILVYLGIIKRLNKNDNKVMVFLLENIRIHTI